MKHLSLSVVAGLVLGLVVLMPQGQAADKATICHVPPGNSANMQELNVGVKALDAHLAHGDHLGNCENESEPDLPEFDDICQFGCDVASIDAEKRIVNKK